MMVQMAETTDKFMNTTATALSDTQAQLQTQGVAIRNLEVKYCKLNDTPQGNLLSNTNNPRENCNAVSLRGSKVLEETPSQRDEKSMRTKLRKL